MRGLISHFYLKIVSFSPAQQTEVQFLHHVTLSRLEPEFCQLSILRTNSVFQYYFLYNDFWRLTLFMCCITFVISLCVWDGSEYVEAALGL